MRQLPEKTFMRKAPITFAMVVFCISLGWSQAKLSAHWEELTAA
jgi:hypothetical protein